LLENDDDDDDDDKECECLVNDDCEVSKQQRAENAIAAKYERVCNFCRRSFATFADVKKSQNPDSLVANEYELMKGGNEINEVPDRTLLCLATTCPNTDDVTSSRESGTNELGTDDSDF
jgi:hypothetical protein